MTLETKQIHKDAVNSKERYSVHTQKPLAQSLVELEKSTTKEMLEGLSVELSVKQESLQTHIEPAYGELKWFTSITESSQ